MISLPAHLRQRIFQHARGAYPNESCGLLVGFRNGDDVTIVEVHESDNLTSGDPAKTFEVDPKLRFDVMRACEAEPDDREIIGHFHSHPDGPAEPSATDLKMVYEPDFVWLICAVTETESGPLNGFKPRQDASAFDPVPIDVDRV